VCVLLGDLRTYAAPLARKTRDPPCIPIHTRASFLFFFSLPSLAFRNLAFSPRSKGQRKSTYLRVSSPAYLRPQSFDIPCLGRRSPDSLIDIHGGFHPKLAKSWTRYCLKQTQQHNGIKIAIGTEEHYDNNPVCRMGQLHPEASFRVTELESCKDQCSVSRNSFVVFPRGLNTRISGESVKDASCSTGIGSKRIFTPSLWWQ
jgi:hypothetical protein